MLILFRISIWLIFLLLCAYVYYSSTKDEFDEKHTYSIRKLWYLIYILGSLIVITRDPMTLFNHWEKYLIALVCFIVIDSLLFLNLYVSKLGGQELTRTKKQVRVTQEKYDNFIRKSTNISETLKSFEFPVYNLDKDEYFYHLEKLLQSYGDLENLKIDLLPYRNDSEVNELLKDLGSSKEKVRRVIKYSGVFISQKDNLALYRFKILEENYVIKVKTSSDEVITEIDGNAITTMVIAFTLGVGLNNNSESGEEDVNG